MIRTITDNCYVDLAPPLDRTPAPLSEIEAFMAAKTFYCEALVARITAEQCAANRKRPEHDCYPCHTCSKTKQEEQKRPRKSGWQIDNERGMRMVRKVVPSLDKGKAVKAETVKKAARQRPVPSPSYSPVVMQIFTIVQQRLQEVRP